jgi:hypothetical protein
MRSSLLFLSPALALSFFAAACSTSGALVASGGAPDTLACDAPCGPVTLASGQQTPGPIVVANGQAFWLSTSLSSGGDGTLRSVPTAGGAVTDLASVLGATPEVPNSLAADDANVYWIANGGSEIEMISQAGTTLPQSLYSAAALPGGIAIGGGYVYTSSEQNVVRISTTGTVTVIAANTSCNQVAVDANQVYCLNESLVVYPLSGEPAFSLLSPPAGGNTFVGLALDSAYAYVSEQSDGGPTYTFVRVPLAGGSPTTLAVGVPMTSQSFVVGSDGLFWVGGVAGTTNLPLMQLPTSGGTPTAVGTGDASFLFAAGPGVYLATTSGSIVEQGF